MVKKVLRKTLSIIERPIKKTNWYKRKCLDTDNYPTNEWYRKHEERNFDIVNLGSSSAVYAFDYTETGLKAFNWALQPQSMEYSFKVLQNFFSILKHGGIVVIPLSPFSGLSIPEGKWSTDTIDRYYGILDASLIEGYETVAHRRQHPLLENPKLSIKRLIRDIPSRPHPLQCNNENDFNEDARKWIDIWMNEFKISDLRAPLTKINVDGMAKRQDTMKKMIEFCRERSLHPVIVIPPVHPSLVIYFDKTFKDNYISSFLSGLDLNQVICLDWLNPKECPIDLDDSDFINSFFLNNKGAKKFTSSFISCLRLKRVL